MKEKGLFFMAMIIGLSACGVKGPPLPPIKPVLSQVQAEDQKTSTQKVKKKEKVQK